jgi:uncharacterized repeat protein (TIGR01451 family)
MANARKRTDPIAFTASVLTTVTVLVASTTPAHAGTPDTCSEVAVVVDESGSMSPYEGIVRDSLHALINPLIDSGVEASLVEFGTSAKLVFEPTPITATSLSTIFDPYIDADPTSTDQYDAPSQLGGWTNWDDALDTVSQMTEAPPLTVFLTDGDPTAYNLDGGGTATSADPATATAKAVEEADQIRSKGSHIIAIAVGSDLTEASSINRLQEIAGYDIYPGDGPLNLSTTDVISVPEFDALPETMSLIAEAMCADPEISVEKSVDEPTMSAGSEVTYSILVTNTGNVALHDVDVSDPSVPECSETIGLLDVGTSHTITCTVTLWGSLTNIATATGSDPFGTIVTDYGSAQVSILAPGTGTPGFWKNHSDVWPTINGEILIGDWNHTWTCDPDEICLFLAEQDALEALSRPPKGDMTWNLGRALVAAWLNVSAGNDSTCVTSTIDLATGWLTIHSLGSGVSGDDDAWTEASVWAEKLDDYNNGLLCAQHRDSPGSESDAEITVIPGDAPSASAEDSQSGKRLGEGQRSDHSNGSGTQGEGKGRIPHR